MICIYSPTNTDYTHNGDATLIPIRCELSMSINGAWQLTLEHPYDPEERYKYITEGAVLRVDINSVREQTTTRQRFRVYQYTKGLNSVTAIAFPIAMESTYDAPIDNLVLTAKTGAQAMSDINTKIGTSKYTLSSDIATVKSASYSNTNANSVIAGGDANCFIKVWGGEIIYDNYKYSVKQRLGDTNENNHKIQYGRNLSSIDLQKDDSGLTTRIYPISADGIRLNGSGYVDSSHVSDYPVVHHRFMTAPYNLIEQNETSNSATAVLTRTALQAVSTQASTLAQAAYDEAIDQGVQPEFINKNRNEIVKAVQNMALANVLSTSYYQACANVIANALSFLDEVEQPEWTWHGDAETGYWYGDEDGYAKNMYVKISKTWSYFGNDGIWQEPRDDKGTWDWYQDSTGKKYGNFDKYFAHNEYVYITMEGTLTCYWFNEEGWYESEYTEASSWTWHGSGTAEDPYWFGEEDAGDNSKKYAHDCWIFIDGVYYFFDSYGYYDGTTKFEDYQWDWVESDERYWFGNAEDKTYAATYLVSQWAKINGDWYYFDANGYAELKNESIARVNTIFTTEMAALATTVNTQMTALYTLLYQLMTAWCNSKFAEGIDQPMLTITVDMVDLSKTTEYEGFTDLVNIKLGDSVKCEDYEHDIIYSNRVIGLTYDCIRDFNKAVVIGTAAQTVAQILGNASGQANAGGFDTTAIDNQLQAQNAAIGALQSGKQDKLTAGQNITIVNNVISATGGGQGLQYWTETSEKISRNIEETVPQGDFICDDVYYRSYGLDITTKNGNLERHYKSLEEAPAICAIMHRQGSGTEVWHYGIVISPNINTAKLTNGQGATGIEILGRTFYVNSGDYFQPGIITDDDNLPDIGFFESFSDGVSYLISHAGISITAYKETGIGVGEKVIWGGKKEHSTDTPPFYVNDGGEVYAQKYISVGTKPGASADAAYKKTRNYEVGHFPNGQGWFRCMVTRISTSDAPVVIGYTSNGHNMIVVASLEPLDFQWGWSDGSVSKPYGVAEWGTADTYPLYAGGYENYFGFAKETVTYNGATWYILAIDTYYWSGGTIINDIEQFVYNYYDASDPKAGDAGLALLAAANAKSQIPIILELKAKDYIFKYYTEEETIVEIDDEGNALVKEITTAAGSLTNQMAAKQNLLTAGDNINIDGDTISATDTTYNNFTGATAQEAGAAGLVPAPATTDTEKYLKGDGTWATPSGGTEVEANPTGTATDTLNKVKIENTIYNLPSGGGSFVGLTKSEYEALPAAEKEDTSKLYFVQEGGGLPIIEDLIQTANDWSMYREGSMTVTWANDTIVFDWIGGSNIGCNIVKIAPIPASATKIKFKITTGNSYSNTIDRFRVFIGVRTTYQTGVILPYYSINDWLAKSDYYTRNSVWESELDLSGVTVDTYLYITAHGWDATVDYLQLETPSAAKVTRHIYWNDAKWAQWKTNEITYGTAAPTEAGTDGDLFILLDNNNNKIGEYLYITNAWVQIE